MKLLKVSAIVLGGLVASDGKAQEAGRPTDLNSRLKDTLRGKGDEIFNSSKEIYLGGTQYGKSLVTPNRSEQQTREGVTGGFRAVGGAATLAGTIGGTAGSAATMMAVPIADGAEPMAAWVGNGNSIARKLQLLDQGNIGTLQREESDQIRHNQAVGDRFKSTTTQLITNPAAYNAGPLVDRLNSLERDSLPAARQRIARDAAQDIPQQPAQGIQSRPSAPMEAKTPPRADNLNELCGKVCVQDAEQSENRLPANEEPQPLHWKTLSGIMRNPGAAPEAYAGDEIGRCEPVPAKDAYEYIAWLRSGANEPLEGARCSPAQFLDDTTNRLTYTMQCQMPNWGRSTVLHNFKVRDDRTIEAFTRYKIQDGSVVEMQVIESYCG